MRKVLISGGSGTIGTHLTKQLIDAGYGVSHLSRIENLTKPIKSYYWNVEQQQINLDAFEGVDYIVHLAGTGIADKRWSDVRKKEIIASRTESTQLLYNSVDKLNIPIKAFVGASAVGYYGAVTNEHFFKEEEKAGSDFLGETCRNWEEAYEPFVSRGIRTVKIRVGVVLDDTGGALKKMTTPIKAGFGAALGTGKQYIPWIHIEDICGIFKMAIENDKMKGVYNAAATNAVNNYELSKLIAKTLKKPFFMPAVPAFVLKLMFGEMASIFLEGSRVNNQKIINEGYSFIYNNIEPALKNLFFKNIQQ